MPHIKFLYEYRDAGNYKRQGEVVFGNPEKQADLDGLDAEIRSCLFDEEFFYPHRLVIPLIHFEPQDPALDHGWYRYRRLEVTGQAITDPRPIDAFINDLRKFAKEPVL